METLIETFERDFASTCEHAECRARNRVIRRVIFLVYADPELREACEDLRLLNGDDETGLGLIDAVLGFAAILHKAAAEDEARALANALRGEQALATNRPKEVKNPHLN
jgi:hypothetical protein